jgi:hypothetical protein
MCKYNVILGEGLDSALTYSLTHSMQFGTGTVCARQSLGYSSFSNITSSASQKHLPALRYLANIFAHIALGEAVSDESTRLTSNLP